MEPIAPDTATATEIAGNMALVATLQNSARVTSAPTASKGPCPEGVAPKDFYFPPELRNEAPVIEVEYNSSVSVQYKTIEQVVSGTSSNASDSVAFWKQPSYKYEAPDTSDTSDKVEVLDTTLYEAYFPTKIRNVAPKIEMRSPAFEGDTTGYFMLDSEYVELNSELAQKLSVSAPEDEPALNASATVAKYFGKDMHYAPSILITEEERVEFGLAEVALPTELADDVTKQLAEAGVTSTE